MSYDNLINNLSLLLGTQHLEFINKSSKPIDVTEKYNSMQILSKGFNIYSLKLNYNRLRKKTRVNLRRRLKLESPDRTLLLPVMMTSKDHLIKIIDGLNKPNIHTVEFSTNLNISTVLIEGDGIIPITLFGHKLYINYNEESELHTYKIDEDNLNKRKVKSIIGGFDTKTSFDKYDYGKPSSKYTPVKLHVERM